MLFFDEAKTWTEGPNAWAGIIVYSNAIEVVYCA